MVGVCKPLSILELSRTSLIIQLDLYDFCLLIYRSVAVIFCCMVELLRKSVDIQVMNVRNDGGDNNAQVL